MSHKHYITPISCGGLVFAGLYLTSLYNYLVFHSLVEIFSVVIAGCISVFAWNARRFMENDYLAFLGVAYLFVGGLDLLHTLSYKGMGIFQGYGANLPTQLWIAARYTESLSLFAAFLAMKRPLRIEVVFVGYAVFAAALLFSIFAWKIFPVCFDEENGLTGFKIASEYVVCAILVGVAILLKQNRDKFDADVFRLLIAAVVVTICGELAFTRYVDVYGFSNLVGHFFKVVSFYLVYKAVIETGFEKPHRILYRDLKRNEERLYWESSVNSALAELAGSLIASMSMPEISRLVLRHGQDLTGSETGMVFHAGGENGEDICCFRKKGDADGCSTAPPEEVLPQARHALDWTARNQKPLVVKEPGRDPRFSGNSGEAVAIDSFLAVPSVIDGETVGQIAMVNPGRDFDDSDVMLVSRLADLYALAIGRMREEQRQKKAMYKEFLSMESMHAGSVESISETNREQATLRVAMPDRFEELVRSHGQLLEASLEESAFKGQRRVDGKIRDLAWRLGALKACPRDVIEVHMTSLKRKCKGSARPKASAYADEGRLVALTLMGYLATYYQMQAGRATRNTL